MQSVDIGADTRSMAHGITMVHVNRTLKKLRDVISVGHGLAQIHDIEALATHAAPIQDIFERESASFGGGMPGGSMSS